MRPSTRAPSSVSRPRCSATPHWRCRAAGRCCRRAPSLLRDRRGPTWRCCASGSPSPRIASDKAAGDVHDEALAAAVRHFQGRHGLEDAAASDRGCWPRSTRRSGNGCASLPPRSTGSRSWISGSGRRSYVVVNLPAAFAEAVDGDKVVRRYVVQVGRPERPSPTLTTQITTVNLNPTWTVPLGILKKDVIPKMRKDRATRRACACACWTAPATRSTRTPSTGIPTARPISPSGRIWGSGTRSAPVRIDMPNPHSVYMHDTNHKELFSADYRFQSSGYWVEDSVRSRPGCSPTIPAGAAARSTPGSPGERMDIRLAHKVPVAWVYLTGWATGDGLIHFRDDVLRPRREAGLGRRRAAAGRERGARLRFGAQQSADAAARCAAGVLPRQPVVCLLEGSCRAASVVGSSRPRRRRLHAAISDRACHCGHCRRPRFRQRFPPSSPPAGSSSCATRTFNMVSEDSAISTRR